MENEMQTQDLKGYVYGVSNRSIRNLIGDYVAHIHSPKLTWKPIQPPFRRTVVFIGPFLGFHVSFQECNHEGGPPTTSFRPRRTTLLEQAIRSRGLRFAGTLHIYPSIYLSICLRVYIYICINVVRVFIFLLSGLFCCSGFSGVFFLLFGRGRVYFFAVWAGGVFFFFFAVWAGGVFFFLLFGRGACSFFAVWAGACSFFCCWGRGRVFFFAVWAGDGSSLTYPSAWLVFERPNNKRDRTAKKNTGSMW